MANEMNIGTGRVDIIANTESFEASIERSKTMIDGFSQAARSAYDQADSKQQTAARSLLRYVELLGKTPDQVKLLRAAWNGVPIEIINNMANEMQNYRNSVDAATQVQKEQNDSWRMMQQRAQAAARELREVAAAEMEAAAAKRAAAAAQQQEFDLAGRKAAENNYLREQQRVVAALTQEFHRLEAAEQLAAKGDEFVRSLERQVNAMNMTQSELLELKAAELGVTSQAAPFIKAMRDREKAYETGGNAVNKYGLSVKMHTAAMRQVPAQITDIFVSLAGGQSPMMVLLQQGGQLKDVFGGVKPAVEGLLKGIVGMINPLTLVAAAGAGVAYSFYNAEQEVSKINAAIQKTNGYAGVTVSQVQVLAGEMNSLAGESYGKAVEALSQVIGTGKFIADEIEMVAVASEKMRITTGQDVKDTVAEFVKLKDDPVAAILALNESQHFLTQSTYDQIKAFQDQGDYAAAGALAMETYSDNVDKVTANIEENIGTLQRMARWVKEIWNDITDAVLGIGRAVTFGDQVKQAQGYLKDIDNAIAAKTTGSAFDRFSLDSRFANKSVQQLQQMRNDQATQVGRLSQFLVKPTGGGANGTVNSKEIQRREAAERNYQALVSQGYTDREKYEKRVIELRKAGEAAGKSEAEIQKGINGLTREFNEKQARANKRGGGTKRDKGAGEARSLANAEARAELQEFKNELAEKQMVLRADQQILQAMRSQNLITEEDYYTQSKELLVKDTAAQEESLTKQIDYLKSRNVTGKDSVEVQRQIADAESQLRRVRYEGALQLKLTTMEEVNAAKKRKWANDDYAKSLTDVVEEMKVHNELTMLAAHMGAIEFQQTSQLIQIYRTYAKALEELNKQKERGDLSPEDYATRKNALEVGARDQVKIARDGFAQEAALRKDWLNGVGSAMRDYYAQIDDLNQNAKNLTTGAMQTASSGIVDMLNGVEGAFENTLVSMLKSIEQFLADQAIAELMKMLGSFMVSHSNSGSIWASIGNALGGFTGGSGGYETFATGGAFTNGIVTKPTMFNMGQMGEAGPEAIMPLSRGADGSLGVRMHGGGAGGSNVSIVINTNVTSSGTSSTTSTQGDDKQVWSQFSKNVKILINEEVDTMLRPNGKLARAGVRGY